MYWIMAYNSYGNWHKHCETDDFNEALRLEREALSMYSDVVILKKVKIEVKEIE